MSGPWLLAGAILGGLLFLAVCYSVPEWWVVKRYDLTNPKDKADVIDAYRKTFAQVIGSFALAVTFGWTFLKDRETLDLSKRQLDNQSTFQLTQLTNQQFVEGAKLLKENIGASAAGVHVLEHVASTQLDFQSSVVTTLVSFITSGKAINSKNDHVIPDGAPGTIPANIQAAISVIARRNQSTDEQIIGTDKIYRHDGGSGTHFRLTLSQAYLVRARFSGQGPETAFRNVSFQGASLYGADFHGLDLSNTGFDGSWMADWEAFGSSWTTNTPKETVYVDANHLFTVNFQGAKLVFAGFDNAWMGGANLRDADLTGTSFYRADLSRANLTGAKLTGPKNEKKGTSFEEATLTDAIFSQTDLEGVNFRLAKLHGTNFAGAKNVEKADFTEACSDREPLFDEGVRITVKSCN